MTSTSFLKGREELSLSKGAIWLITLVGGEVGRWGQIRPWVSGINIYEGVRFEKGGSF